MQLIVDRKIVIAYPDLKVGAIIVRGFNNGKRSSMAESLLRGAAAQKQKEFAEKELGKDPMIQPWEQAYGMFGGNPKKYPPMHVSLIKKLKPGKEPPHVTLLTDICNYFTFKYLLPIRAIDVDSLYNDLTLTYTQGKEAFRPANTVDVEDAAEGEVAYMDRGGIIFRYWNNRECERTKLNTKTVNAIILIEDLSKMHFDKFGKVIEEIANAVAKYAGGRVETQILTEENLSIDIGVGGRMSANDKKITKAEKVHFEETENAKKKRLKKPKKTSKKTAKTKKPMQMSLIQQKNGLFFDSEDFLKEKIKKIMEYAVIKSFPKAMNFEPQIEYPASHDHGDYSCNIAFQLAKTVGAVPHEIANAIFENIPENEFVDRVEIAGAGFINFFIKKEVLDEEVEKVLKQKDEYGQIDVCKDKTIVLDYSSPNIAKPLGVHHLLSTIIGQSICNIFKKIGAKTVSINHIGDWGTQFGKLIYSFKKWGNKETVEQNPIDELLKLYIKFHDESEKNPKLDDEARNEFKKFEEGDEGNKKLWEWFVYESLKEIEKTYKKLGGIHFDYIHGESFYEDKMEDVLKEGKEKDIFVKGEEGAYVVKYDDPDMAPFVVQKKDGTTLYST
ncbi:MAG: arginine--tRNA ligase, partial [Candidatus Gracilibacteria bacterium]